MASKRQRSAGSWEFVVKRKGLLPKPVHLTFDNEAKGDAYCAHLEKLLDAGIVPEEFLQPDKDAITTIGKAIVEYIDSVHITDDDIGILAHIRKSIGENTLDKVNYPWAEKWVKTLQADDAAPSTIRKKVGALARCLDWLVRRANTVLVANPLRMLPKRYATTADGRKDVERDRRLQEGKDGKPSEEQRIIAILNKEKPEGRQRPLELPDAGALKLMFTVALETMMRMREIYTLTKDQVNFEQKTIFLEKTKNGDKRQVPMSPVVYYALEDYIEKYVSEDGEKIFPFWDGSLKKEDLKATTNRLSHQWSRIFDAAQCPDLHWHDIRHEATSRFFERTDYSDIEIAKIGGWRNPKVLMRYANLRGSNLAARMWKSSNPAPLPAN